MIEVKVGKLKLAAAAQEVFAFVEASVSSPLSRVEKVSLTIQVMKCLTRYITDTLKIPLTVTILFKNLHLLSFAVEQSFPMYAQAKLLKYIITPQALTA